MDNVSAGFVGTPGAFPLAPGTQGPTLAPTAGLFGTGGEFGAAQAFSTTSAISSGIGAFSSIAAGNASASQFNTQAASYELQAEGLELTATERGNILKKQLLMDIGSATASAGARGIDVGSGSPREVIEQSISNVKSDVAKIEAGGRIDASGSRVSAANSRASGATARMTGSLNAAKSIAGYGLTRVL